MLKMQLKAGHEQAGATSPAIADDGDFSDVQMPFLGDAFAHAKNAYVEWTDKGRDYAVFLAKDDAIDLAASLERMWIDGVVERMEIWPGNKVPEKTFNRLWDAVARRRREWENVRWKAIFGRYGFHAPLDQSKHIEKQWKQAFARAAAGMGQSRKKGKFG